MMREFQYSYSRNIAYKTYRVNGGSGDRYNWTTGQYGQTGSIPLISGTRLLGANVLLTSPDTARLPHGTVFTYEVVAGDGTPAASFPRIKIYYDAAVILDHTLTALDDGVPQSFSYNVPGYNFRITSSYTFFILGGVWRGDTTGARRTLTIDNINWYVPEGAGADPGSWMAGFSPLSIPTGVSAKIQRGVSIGRFPVFPRNLIAEWYSVRSYNGEAPFGDYDPDVAATMDGRLCNLRLGNNSTTNRNNTTSVYQRHTNIDTHDLFYNCSEMTYSIRAATGQGSTIISGGRIESNIMEAGTGPASYTAQGEAIFDEIVSNLEAISHIYVTGTGSPSAFVSNQRILHAVPVDAPAGLLCGVIEQGGEKYYIWRKTSESRGGYDFDRDQATGILNSF
jgi:hypothetical protein